MKWLRLVPICKNPVSATGRSGTMVTELQPPDMLLACNSISTLNALRAADFRFVSAHSCTKVPTDFPPESPQLLARKVNTITLVE